MRFPTGADVIAGKASQFIARPPPAGTIYIGEPARHEWLGLARDDIGACEFPLGALFTGLSGR